MTKPDSQDTPFRWGSGAWVWLLVGIATIVVALGAWGYADYLPGARRVDVAFHAVNLLALNFHVVPGASVPVALDVARFLAHALAGLAIAILVIGLLGRRFEEWRVSRWSGHVTVLGDGETARRLATAYREAGERVALVATVPEELRHGLRRRGVRVVPGAAAQRRPRIVTAAARVILAGSDDDASLHLLAMLWEQLPPQGRPKVHVLVQDPELAVQLRSSMASEDDGSIDVCCVAERAAAWVLQQRPPYHQRVTEARPVVVGQGVLAREIVRRMVRGWYSPGERMEVRLLRMPQEDVAQLQSELGEICTLSTPASPDGSPDPVHAILGDTAHDPAEATEEDRPAAPPTVIVAGLDDSSAVVLLRRLAARLAPDRIAAVVDQPERLDPLVADPAATPTADDKAQQHAGPPLLARSRVTEPEVLETDRPHLLAAAFHADQRHWQKDAPSVFGTAARGGGSFDQLPPELARPFLDVACAVPKALARAGLEVARGSTLPPVLLPEELLAIAAELADVDRNDHAPSPDPEAIAEQLQSRLEFAAQLPALLARVGDDVRRLEPPRLVLGHQQIEAMARETHRRYRQVHEREPELLEPSDAAHQEWEQLSPFMQESNRAQIRDIPVKLAMVSRTLCHAEHGDDDRSWLDEATVKRLAEWEHRRWDLVHKRGGYQPSRVTDHGAKQHRSVDRDWHDVGPQQLLDRNAVTSIPDLLAGVGLATRPRDDASSLQPTE